MGLFKTGFVGLLLLGIGTGVVQAASTMHVEKMAVGSAIDARNLEGAAATFDATIPQIYCWTRVTSESVPTTLKHIWSLDGKQMAEVSLPISYASMRTWSSKTPAPGSWKVDAVDPTGTVLSSVSFIVTASTAVAK